MRRNDSKLSELLLGAVARPEIVRYARAAQVLKRWNEIVGEQLAAVSAPTKWDSGRLQVTVSTAGWLQDLRLLSSEILKRLNSAGEGVLFEEIRFQLGELPEPEPEPEIAVAYEVSELDIEFQTPELREIGLRALGRMKSASERDGER